jgi:long-chain fatty acid transport protein
LALACGVAADARAAGFALHENSAEGLGDAFAGQTAKAYDATTVFYNPAGMTRLNSNEIDGTVNWIAPRSVFHGTNSSVLGGDVPGTTGDNAVKAAATGAAYGIWDAAPDWRFGFAVTTPFGMRVDYKESWVGRYQAEASDLTVVDLGLNAAYRVDEHLSIGGGPRIDFLKARLSQAVNFNAIGLQTAQGYQAAAQQAAGAARQLAAAGQTQAAAAAQAQASALAADAVTTSQWGDGLGKVEGYDNAIGYNLGLLYEFNPATRVGLDYRSRMYQRVDGRVTNQVPTTLNLAPASVSGLFADQSVSAKVNLPDSINIGGYHELNSQWALLSDVQWTHWSLFRQLNVVGANGQAISSTTENWQDTWFVSVGANYKVDEKWTVRGGVAFDQSPVKSEYRTVRIPDSNRYWVAAGVTYAVLPSADVHFGYAHLFADKASISETANSLAGALTGSYDNSVDIVSAGFSFRF